MSFLLELQEILSVYAPWQRQGLFLVFLSIGAMGIPIFQTDLMLFLGGVLAAKGILDPSLTFILAPFFVVMGDSVVYTLGRKFGFHVLRIWPFNKMVTKSRIFWFSRLLRQHGYRLILFSRFVPGARFASLLTYGIFKVKYHIFFFGDLFALILFSTLVQLLGYFFCASIEDGLHFSSYILILLGMFGVTGIFVLLKSHMNISFKK